MGFNPKWYSITEHRPSIIHYSSCILPILNTHPVRDSYVFWNLSDRIGS